MFEDLRLRITIMFTVLSVALYVVLAVVGLLVFESGLSASLDSELRLIASEIGHAIDIQDGVPTFRDWIRTVQTEPPRSLATIQLFDEKGLMLEHYGPPGIETFLAEENEAHAAGLSVRVLRTPLIKDGRTYGYVQLQMSTKERDNATRQLRYQAVLLGIVFILLLSLISYYVSSFVTRPVQDSINILRSFVADASHELNTPISILQARMEALGVRLERLGIEAEEIQVSEKAIERLDKVISDLLLLSEVEAPLPTISKAPLDAGALVKEVVEQVKERYLEKNVDLKFQEIEGLQIRGNKESLLRLLANLLENALRYTDSGGAVSIVLSKSEKHVRMEIRDTGIGIAAEHLPRLFDRFFRVDKSRSRASGGTGLGLAIVKAIAGAHRATIQVESQLGAGTAFSIVFPSIK